VKRSVSGNLMPPEKVTKLAGKMLQKENLYAGNLGVK